MNKDEKIKLFEDFLKQFEVVFDDDWGFTELCMNEDNIKNFIQEEGTFIDPGVSDEKDNWEQRGILLELYRKIRREGAIR